MGYSASVVVPTRGGVCRLPRLVEALAGQTRTDFETIFVVDGDIDNSTEYLEGGGVKNLLPNSSVISFTENRGRVAALNAGHEVASGDVIIRCDDDLDPGSAYVQNHVSRHQGELSGIIGLTRNILPESSYAKVYGRQADAQAEESALALPEDLRWRHWAGNVSIPRAIWNEVGPYDSRYRKYGWEDVDYGYRIHQAGYPILIAPELTTDHYAASVTTRIRSIRALHSGAAREKFVEIHGAGVLPETIGKGIWDTSVTALAAISTERSITLMSSVVDSLIQYVPEPVGRKLVAILVESAGQAGVRYPSRARSSF